MVVQVTIIIPMRSEAEFVGGCLDSVLGQIDGLAECEVLCVDGVSEDRTRDVVLEHAARDARVKLLDNPDRIVPTAMNLGIRAAWGDIIIRMDCHCEYAPDYIEKCIEVLQRTGADNVGGYIRTLPGKDTPTGRGIAAATSSGFGIGGGTFRTAGSERETDTVPFGCFRRDVFYRVGLYDERLVRNQDIEFNDRLRRGAGQIVISPEIRLTYFCPSTLGGVICQAFRNGLWNPYTIYLIGRGLGIRHFVPFGAIAAGLLLLAAGFIWTPLWFLLMCAALFYAVLAIAAAVQAAREAKACWPLVALTFPILHVSYGLGSLCGVFSAPLRFGLHPRQYSPPSLDEQPY